jgi:hypothetical protein
LLLLLQLLLLLMALEYRLPLLITLNHLAGHQFVVIATLRFILSISQLRSISFDHNSHSMKISRLAEQNTSQTNQKITATCRPRIVGFHGARSGAGQLEPTDDGGSTKRLWLYATD